MTAAPAPCRVLIVDDSAMTRRVLADHLARDPEIEVVGEAGNAYQARDLIVELEPEVVTLDVEMPGLDGLAFLEKLMQHHPMPVVMVSAVTTAGSAAAMRALELGAVEVIGKPAAGDPRARADMLMMLADKIKAAARARLGAGRAAGAPAAPVRARVRADNRLIAIGASTGGPEALKELFSRLPAGMPPILLVQHMPAGFTAKFAEHLNAAGAMEVREAAAGDELRPGLALLAPGGRHLTLDADGRRVEVKDGPFVCRQRPSVEVLFHSVARVCGKRAIGVILTGMGADGAQGLLALRRAGGRTLGQDEKSSIVYGMPRVAYEAGAVEKVVPLGKMADEICRLLAD